MPDQPLPDDDRQTTYNPSGALPPSDDRATSFIGAGGLGSSAGTGAAPASAHIPRPNRAYAAGSTVLHGRYRLDSELKGGNQAKAFRATRLLDGTAAFVKLQANPTNRSDAFAKQIGLRDKILAIQHPHLLRCFDFDLDGDALCEVYEWLDGQELSQLLGHGLPPFDEPRLRRMVEQLAGAIQELHTATGLSHRDLKPDNVRVVHRNGQECFVVVDYGLVSQLDSGGATTVGGTRLYSPPEFYLRRIPNDPLLGKWDWWSLGRIVQEAIDGIHPYDRLPALFNQDIESGKFGNSGRIALETMFDMIMLERDQAHFNLRAGMVELSEPNCRLPAWLPLLRGLLTSNRRSRWGYEQVRGFLRGDQVPVAYRAAMDVDGFEFEESSFTLPELAAKLTSEATPETEAAAERWRQAQELIYRGALPRYIASTLHDGELSRLVQDCQSLDDRDLGTGLALAAISSGALPANVRGVEINASFLIHEAEKKGNDRERLERVKTLLSPGFQELLKRLHPPGAAELEAESDRLKGFRKVCNDMDVQYDAVNLASLVKLQHTPDANLITAITSEFRTKINHTTRVNLQRAFAEPDLAKLNPFQLRALYLSLTTANKHGYVSHEERARSFHVTAKKMGNALALKKAAFYLGPWFKPFTGHFGWLTALVGMFSIAWMYRGTAFYAMSNPTPNGYIFNGWWLTGAAVGCGLTYAVLGLFFKDNVAKFARKYVDFQSKDITADLLRETARKIGGEVNYQKELAKANQEISAVPHVDHNKFLVPLPNVGRVRWAIYAQIALLAFVFSGGFIYGRLFLDPAPAPPAPLPGKTPAKKNNRR